MTEPKIVICEKNHIYDAAIYSCCPYCKKIAEEQQELSESVSGTHSGTERRGNITEDEYTELLEQREESEDDDECTELIGSETVSLESERDHQEKIIGWFVIKEGMNQGHSIEVFDNTVCLKTDTDGQLVASSLEQDAQSVLLIDKEKTTGFVKVRGTSLYVNGKMRKTEVLLRSYDEITVKSFQLVYVELMTRFLGWED
uniref:hypothetical protein n=1 Tax=Eubacterium cellulosolvens TaxID=29322 RepID=UPI0004801989|nr:hypothetical protein [[Eubacterium] cellulosolvens]